MDKCCRFVTKVRNAETGASLWRLLLCSGNDWERVRAIQFANFVGIWHSAFCSNKNPNYFPKESCRCKKDFRRWCHWSYSSEQTCFKKTSQRVWTWNSRESTLNPQVYILALNKQYQQLSSRQICILILVSAILYHFTVTITARAITFTSDPI